jgi:hydrogenase maturation protease
LKVGLLGGSHVIRVLGMGNVLMSDDGFGPYVVHVLEATYECPPGVEFVDVGTPGLDLTPYLLDADAVIFLDTVSSRGAPGELRTYERDDILKHPPQTRTGPHDPALKEALLTVVAAGAGPARVLLIGVIPRRIATGVALSPQVQAAVGPAIRAVVAVLEELGTPIAPRAQVSTPDIWWTRSNPSSLIAHPESLIPNS